MQAPCLKEISAEKHLLKVPAFFNFEFERRHLETSGKHYKGYDVTVLLYRTCLENLLCIVITSQMG